MNSELYREYLSLKALGLRDDSKEKLMNFIDSFADIDEKEVWVRGFIEEGNFEHKIRHEIFEQLVFPVLYEGYKENDFWAIWSLSKVSQNLYDSKAFWKKVDYNTDHSLLRRCFELNPEHQEVRKELLDALLGFFRYSMHEWPSGILYGNDGADQKQSQEILEEIGFARLLDSESLYEELLFDFEGKVREYIKRITQPVGR
jgi:hypothetical protein